MFRLSIPKDQCQYKLTIILVIHFFFYNISYKLCQNVILMDQLDYIQ